MPMPNRLPYWIDDAIGSQTIGRLIDDRAVIALACHGCWHETVWGAAELQVKFPGQRARVFSQVGPHLRCSKCRSEWLEAVRLHGQRADAHNARQPSAGARLS